jgi:hypothetical protein
MQNMVAVFAQGKRITCGTGSSAELRLAKTYKVSFKFSNY